MKILFLSSRYAPDGHGGAERVARTLATALSDAGDEVVVLTTATRGTTGERIVDGVRVRSVGLLNVYPLTDEARGASMKPLWHVIDAYNFAMKAEVSRVLREEKPDVVHSHLLTGFSASAWTAAHDLGIPVVHTLHDHYVMCARSTMINDGVPCQSRHLSCVALTAPRMFLSRGIESVVGVSRFILDRHTAAGAFDGARQMVIPNPCHLVGRPGAPRRQSTELRLGFMGRLDENKGIELLLDSVRSLTGSWRLRIAGTGDLQFIRRLQAANASERVEFCGIVDPEAFLADVDVLVVPSLVPETFGLSAAEALALGIPVVASIRGALPELVTPGVNGFVFDPDEPGSLSTVLQDLVTRRDLSAMADRCRESVSDLAPGLVAERYREVYRAAFVTRGSAAPTPAGSI